MTLHQGSSRTWVSLSILLFSTSLPWLPRAEAIHAPLDVELAPRAFPARLFFKPATAPIETLRITENLPIPTTDEEFKQLRDSILQGTTVRYSVVDELLRERRSAAKAVI